MPIGNGDFGASMHGTPDNLIFNIAKNDLWWDDYDAPEPCYPDGGIEALRKKIADGDASVKLDMFSAANRRVNHPVQTSAARLTLHLLSGGFGYNIREELDISNGTAKQYFSCDNVNGSINGRDLNVYNNIVVNCNDRSIAYDSRARDGVVSGGWFSHSRDKDMEGGMWRLLFDSPWQTDTWKKAYPQMTKFSDDFNNTDAPEFVPNPAFSDVKNNIIVNIPGAIGNISEAADRFSNVTDNTVYKMKARDDVFEDAANGNYALKNAPDGFEQIPFDKIGRY